LREVCKIAIRDHSKNYVDKMRGHRGLKMPVFVHAQSTKTVHAKGEGVKKWEKSVHVSSS
jgi:hypothetical protein